MLSLRQYIINENYKNDLLDCQEDDCYHTTPIQETKWINPSCLPLMFNKSYIKHIMQIYERLGESIFHLDKIENIDGVEEVYILKNNKTGYAPECPSCEVYYDYPSVRNIIINRCHSMNYSVSKRYKSNGGLYKYYVKIQPNKPRECSQKILDESGGLVIHLTTEYGFEKIMEDGIVPKTPDKENLPEQIYFLSPTNECKDYLLDFIDNLTDNKNKKFNKTTKELEIKYKIEVPNKVKKFLDSRDYFSNVKYAIIFNINELKKHRKINFYEDTSTPGFPAYWTAEYIPKYCIISWQIF